MRKHPRPDATKAPLTPFERETKRRRREMLGHIAGRTARIPNKLLKTFIRQGVKPVCVEYIPGKPVHLTKKYPTRPNPFREMARGYKRGHKREAKA